MIKHTPENLSHRIARMNQTGGYILAFSKSVGIDLPELPWSVFRNKLVGNGTFCGYGEVAVRRAFEEGQAAGKARVAT